MTHDFWFVQLLLTFPKVKWCFVHAYLSSRANIISWWPNVKRHNKCFDHVTLEQVASVSRLVTCRCCHTCDLWHSDTPNVQVQLDPVGSTVRYEMMKLCTGCIRHYEAVAVDNWWYWVSRGHLCLYILRKVKIWKGVTHARLTDWLTDSQMKDSATQLLIKYKSGALVTQFQIKDRDNALKCGHNEGHFQPNSFAIILSSWQRKKTESNLRWRPVINQNFNTCDLTLLFNEFHISL